MKRIRRRLYKYLPIIKFLLLATFICFSVYLFIFRFFPLAFHYLKTISQFTQRLSLKSTNGRTNILLLGAGGANHTAPDLTDSIIFASINLETGTTLLLSVPRDIWIDSMRAKINAAYHYGEEKRKGGGLILAKAATSEILSQPVHYGVLVNFAGFVKAIDLVGGVEIEVERSFDDYKYPVPGMENAEPEGLRYEHIHFDQGLQHMDGERALKYVRSRYAEGEEGTDFARSKRQQKMLLAFKNKVFSIKTLLNPKKISKLSEILGDSIDTDIQKTEYSEFLKLALKLNQGKIKTVVLDEDLLYNPPKSEYDGQWVLAPRTGNWQAVQEYVKSLVISH